MNWLDEIEITNNENTNLNIGDKGYIESIWQEEDTKETFIQIIVNEKSYMVKQSQIKLI